MPGRERLGPDCSEIADCSCCRRGGGVMFKLRLLRARGVSCREIMLSPGLMRSSAALCIAANSALLQKTTRGSE